MENAMLASTLVSFSLLLLSYLWTGVKPEDFGRVPRRLHAYLLIAALAATVAVWVVIVRAYGMDQPDVFRRSLAIHVTLYFLLQLAFIPLVRRASSWGREPVQLLLLACVVPMAFVFGSAWSHSTSSVDVWLTGYVFFHVFVHDALLYGYMF